MIYFNWLDTKLWIRSLDFGKFLELLFYSDNLYRLASPLCEHTTFSDHGTSSRDDIVPEARLTIVRHFTRGPLTIAFSMSRVQDIFDAHIPRCQVTRSIAEVNRKDMVLPDHDEWLRAERDRLRLDMTFYWRAIKDRLHWLVSRDCYKRV